MSNNDMIYYALACIGMILLLGALAGVGFFVTRRRHKIQMRRASFGGGSCILTLIAIGILTTLIFGGVSLVAFGFIPNQSIQIASSANFTEILKYGGGGLLLTVLGAFLLNGGIKSILSRRAIIEDDWGRRREKRGCSAILNGITQALFGLLLLVGGIGMVSLTLYKQGLPWLGL